jgi:hypothetical protein
VKAADISRIQHSGEKENADYTAQSMYLVRIITSENAKSALSRLDYSLSPGS